MDIKIKISGKAHVFALISRAVTFIVASIFIAAGVSKWSDPAAFEVSILHFGFFPASTVWPLVLIVPLVETFVGLACLLSRFSRLAVQLLLFITIAYTLLLLVAWLNGVKPNCGCFGAISSLSSYWFLLSRNMGLLASEAFVIYVNRTYRVMELSVASEVPQGTMCSWNRFKRWSLFVAASGFLICWPVSGQDFEYSASPKRNDNFLEASFRFSAFQGKEPSNTILVFIPGTDRDGRVATSDQDLLHISSNCHANLVGCYFRGEGLSYDDPSAGSGRALEEAITYFGLRTNLPELKHPKLLLIGISQGGMFVYNYICWHPQRVEAFAALRSVFPIFKPQAESFQVPGLLAAGEYDEPGRIRSIASTFKEAEGHNCKWAFLLEKGVGHDSGKSVELAGAFFAAVNNDYPRNSPILLDTMERPVDSVSASTDSCWFPDSKTAELWKSLHRPTTFDSLISLTDVPHLRDLLSFRESPEVFQCKNGESQVGSISLSTQSSKVAIGQVRFSGDEFTLLSSYSGVLPAEPHVCFAPKNMPWGALQVNCAVDAKLDGQVSEAVNFPMLGLVKGPLIPVPSTVYLGIVRPGQEVEKTILLKSTELNIHFSGSRLPSGLTIALNPTGRKSDFELSIHWKGGERLGRMQGQIELTLDAPEKGMLRIPVFGFVAPASSALERAVHDRLSIGTGCRKENRNDI